MDNSSGLDKDFVIEKVGWLTQRPGLEDDRDFLLLRFYTLAKFFQDEGLLTRTIASTLDQVSDDDEIRVGDLTEAGWVLMQEGYPKWAKRVDRTQNATDTSVLVKALKKIRQQTKQA